MIVPSYIALAMNHQGHVVTKSAHNGTKFYAIMEWPHGEKVCGEWDDTIEGAWSCLDRALMEDCAKDMMDKGVV